MTGNSQLLAAIVRIALFTGVFFTQPVRAQSIAGDSANLKAARDVLFRVPLGSSIRVSTVGQSVIEGQLAARSDTGIVVRQGKDSSHASFGTLATGLCDRADCHGAFANGASVGAALGAGIGAAVGLGIGALMHHWERVWP